MVYDQYILGNTVYAVGTFSSVRPAGSPAGTNEVPRTNIVAYDLTTGALIESFNPVFNGPIKTVTASPDGSRIYVGGSFTTVNGSNRYRLVALNPTNGDVISAFFPILNTTVNRIVATDSTVYVGGAFQYAGPGATTPRSRLAAFAASNGALLSWAPTASRDVNAMVMSPKGDRLFVGGSFDKVNGQSALGIAAIDPQDGSLISWPVDQIVHDYGTQSAFLSLNTDGKSIFGSGMVFGGNSGNLEGVFSADPDTGEINWVNDCHGDTYDTAITNGYLYTASHSHLCTNIGSFPQSRSWEDNMRHALSYELDAAGTVGRDQTTYWSFEGLPAPTQAHWYPNWVVGKASGANQATWSVKGNNDYVVYGGEFLSVNGMPQQGLVRFAVRGIAPAKERPREVNPSYQVKLVSDVAGQVRVTIPANYDRDSHELNYRITRDGATIYQTRQASTYWDKPIISYIDKGLTPGQSYSYKVWVTDDDGNESYSDQPSITVAGSGSASPYSDEVLKDGARINWRLAGRNGVLTPDAVGTQDGAVANTGQVTFGEAGAITGDSDAAAGFKNNIGSTVSSPTEMVIPNKFTIETWVKVANKYGSGGRIAGFSDKVSGTSSTYDRVLYMLNNGQIMFGVYTKIEGIAVSRAKQARSIQSGVAINDGQWHHVVASLGDDGMNLYIDGVRRSTRADTTSGDLYYGRFRVGADSLSGWPSRPSRDYLTGSIDEAALYNSVLTPTQVAKHYQLSGRTPSVKTAPADTYGAAVFGSQPFLYYRLDETSGTAAADSGVGLMGGTYAGSITRNQPGGVPGNAAAKFNGSGVVVAATSIPSPGDFSVEAGFNTTSTTGGQIIGFGNSQTGISTLSDRMVYMRNDGTLAFVAGKGTVATTNSYNDGQWHHVVATQGQDGMHLYVDGVEVGADSARVGIGNTTVGNRLLGYWRVGGDKTPADSTSNYFNGLIDEAAVYDRVLPLGEVVTHFTAAGGQLPNVAPTADFSSTASFLDVNVDASASHDSDGSIVSYDWNFGDGTFGTGQTASHTYADGGVYTITLTVTDDRGGIDQMAKTISVSAPVPNVVPVALFTSSVFGLTVGVNGAGSFDTDGSIASYEWTFGDGSSASGVTASHTYAEAGSYTVILTVTDNEGATGSLTQSVDVAEPVGPVVHASDLFERTVTGGWGSADLGGEWTRDGGGASLYSVSGGVGRQVLNVPGRSTSTMLDSVSAKNVTFATDVSFDKGISAGGISSAVSVRRTAAGEYRARLWITASGTDLLMERRVGSVWTTLSSVPVPGLVLSAGDVWRIQLDATGTDPTTLTAKVWNKAGAEPALPNVTVTDSTAALEAPGGVSTYNYLSGSATNAPITVTYDNLNASSTQD